MSGGERGVAPVEWLQNEEENKDKPKDGFEYLKPAFDCVAEVAKGEPSETEGYKSDFFYLADVPQIVNREVQVVNHPDKIRLFLELNPDFLKQQFEKRKKSLQKSSLEFDTVGG